jgi:hypothetical protein
MNQTKEVSMKRFFARHAKSSAVVVSLIIHGGLIISALSIIAVRVLTDPPHEFRPTSIERKPPKKPLNFKPFQPTSKRPQKPVINREPKRITTTKPIEIAIPPVAMIGIPIARASNESDHELLTAPIADIDFFDAGAKGEKVCFIVHFGPATIGKTPYSRMTGYTIRKRLEEIISRLPDYALFNVACYWASDTCAMSPKMIPASSNHKQMLRDWMTSVNPLEGEYDHCFVWQNAEERINSARTQWPTRVEQLPAYSPQWVYPYTVPAEQERKYLDEDSNYVHWGRAVTWSILTQKPDTIFVLTTNYIDYWGSGNRGDPSKMVSSYKKMLRDVYGPNRKIWPTLNVVVLSRAGQNSNRAHEILTEQFGPVINMLQGSGSVIEDISDFMNEDEKKLLRKYNSEHR